MSNAITAGLKVRLCRARRKQSEGGMNVSKSNNSGGIGAGGVLGIVFVTLKLCHVIDWSWWWVTAPFWGGFVLVLGIALIVLIGTGLAALLIALSSRNK